MSKRKLPQRASIPELTNHMLTSIMPLADDPRDCLMGLGVKPTCAAYIVYGMIQKATKGDTSAAKFLNDISGAGGEEESKEGISDLRSLSDSILCRLAGLSLGGEQVSKTNSLYSLLLCDGQRPSPMGEKGDRSSAAVDEV